MFGAALVFTVAACAQPSPPPTPIVPADTAVFEPFPYSVVWTDTADVVLATETGHRTIPFAFTRLTVIGRDRAGLRVLCETCGLGIRGWIREEDVVASDSPPAVAAWQGLAEFALSVRQAAARHDLDALRPVMSPDFTYDFLGIQTPEYAFRVWREQGYEPLDALPALLDRGLASSDNITWAAPPEFVHDLTYQGLRAGFRRRGNGPWEWLYLIRGVAAR